MLFLCLIIDYITNHTFTQRNRWKLSISNTFQFFWKGEVELAPTPKRDLFQLFMVKELVWLQLNITLYIYIYVCFYMDIAVVCIC